MNSNQRKRLSDVQDELTRAQTTLETIADEARESLDSIPENLQQTKHYSNAQDAIDNLDACLSDLAEAIEELQDAIGAGA